MSLSEDILKFAQDRGAIAAGIATVGTLKGGPPSADLNYKMPGARSAISFALPFNREHIRAIAQLELDKVAGRLKERDITLLATEAALEKLAEKGYDPQMGARPLRRVIQLEIEDQLSDALLAEKFKDGDTIWLDVDDKGSFTLSKRETPSPQPEPAPAG